MLFRSQVPDTSVGSAEKSQSNEASIAQAIKEYSNDLLDHHKIKIEAVILATTIPLPLELSLSDPGHDSNIPFPPPTYFSPQSMTSVRSNPSKTHIPAVAGTLPPQTYLIHAATSNQTNRGESSHPDETEDSWESYDRLAYPTSKGGFRAEIRALKDRVIEIVDEKVLNPRREKQIDRAMARGGFMHDQDDHMRRS